MTRSLVRYVAGISIGAVASLVSLHAAAGTPDAEGVKATLFFAALSLLAMMLRYQQRGSTISGNISFIPFLAGSAVSPSALLPLSIAVASITADVLDRKETLKTVFNGAQLALSIALGSLLYLALGGRPMLEDPTPPVPAFVALCAALFLVNGLAISGVVSLAEGRRFMPLYRKRALASAGFDVLTFPIIFLFAYVYVKFGMEWTIGLLFPLLGLRQLYKQNWQLEKTNEELLQLMVAAIEARDPYTSGHSRRVARYAQVVGRAVGLSERQLDRLRVASLLHDVGKIYEMFAPVLRKPSLLSREERRLMELHPVKGAELVGKVSQLQDVLPAVRHHHERWDGTGYPDGIAGEEIPLFARIIAIADTVDAMTTERPYRPPLTELDVRKELERCAGTQFDAEIVHCLIEPTNWTSMAKVIKQTQGETSLPIEDDEPLGVRSLRRVSRRSLVVP
jgi:HD superfamily phosphohydrolase YqeK